MSKLCASSCQITIVRSALGWQPIEGSFVAATRVQRARPSFRSPFSTVLIVGLAPGQAGANRTGRPFTGDIAGRLLFPALARSGLALRHYGASRDDGLKVEARITNTVRCVPPSNRPLATEIRCCNAFLRSEIAAMPRLKIILALGHVAHDATCLSLGLARASIGFSHGAFHRLGDGRLLVDSYTLLAAQRGSRSAVGRQVRSASGRREASARLRTPQRSRGRLVGSPGLPWIGPGSDIRTFDSQLSPLAARRRTSRDRSALDMRATLQQYVDNSISKTINVPESCP
jgi:uracil-DNA glycosylase family 4